MYSFKNTLVLVQKSQYRSISRMTAYLTTDDQIRICHVQLFVVYCLFFIFYLMLFILGPLARLSSGVYNVLKMLHIRLEVFSKMTRQERISIENRQSVRVIFRKIDKIWTCRPVHIKTELLFPKSIVLPTMTYAIETWPSTRAICK